MFATLGERTALCVFMGWWTFQADDGDEITSFIHTTCVSKFASRCVVHKSEERRTDELIFSTQGGVKATRERGSKETWGSPH